MSEPLSSRSSSDAPVLCFGEIVWDALPSGIFLGGAPLNVAYHLQQLGTNALPVSRLGKDFLGGETRRRLRMAGLDSTLVQQDDQLPTGAVVVELNDRGNASYDILKPASWDAIAAEEALLHAARSSKALVYGSLATRSPANCAVLDKLIQSIPVRLCDVNLRAPYDDPGNALEWASKATMVKLNDDELRILGGASERDPLEPLARRLQEQLSVPLLIVTCGGEGAGVLAEKQWHFKEAAAVKVADTVGAGDAFTAAFLHTLLCGGGVAEALDAALKLGGFVASQAGAQPPHEGS
jgi:fructokinase